jgi:hypothetical protein
MYYNSLLMLAITSIAVVADIEIKEVTQNQIYDTSVFAEESDAQRDLQIIPCFNYQYIVDIDDDLRMSYVVTDDRIKVEMEYDGAAWIGLGTHPIFDGKMIGAESWIALPDINSSPVIYNLNSYLRQGARVANDQTLENGFILQSSGSTVMRFDKLLSDGENVPIDGNGEVVFIWAIGRSNSLGYHMRRGAFRLVLEKCTTPLQPKQNAELDVVCGLFSLSLFCPLSGCGFFGRMLGLC